MEDRDTGGGEEIRSSSQAFVRVLLLIVVVAALAGFLYALFLRPGRTIEESGVRAAVTVAAPAPALASAGPS